MSVSQARPISTNQSGVHENLLSLVKRHQQHNMRRPIAQHTQDAFNEMLGWLNERSGDVIIDACCGVGESTYRLAQQFPEANVIGIDKSIARIDKHAHYCTNGEITKTTNGLSASEAITTADNYLLVQANLDDFWRLLLLYIEKEKPVWRVVKQYLLYPNPYPKKTQVGKRWHASPIFPTMLAVCPAIEVRSNWRLYLEEFLTAVSCFKHTGDISPIILPSDKTRIDNVAFTPFERKYLKADQTCFKLVIRPFGADKK